MNQGNPRKVGARFVLREMFRDNPEEMVSPEEVDEAIRAEDPERALQKEEDEQILDYIEPGSEREREEMREAEETIHDLYFGCVVICLPCLLGMLLAPQPLRYGLALAGGCIVAICMLRDMYRTVETVLMLDPYQAERFARKRAVLRYFLMLAFLAGVGYSLGKSAAIGAILGIFSMKFSAYFQPLMRKLRVLIMRKGR